MSNIVLTADRATLSHYRHNLYLGFLSCLPDRLCPEFIYKTIVPAVEPGPGGTVKLPHLSLRAVEAACFHAGFKSEDITILPPDALESKITPDTKIVGISVHDPLGYGPATTTWSTIFKGVPFNRIYFLRLMDRVRALKRKHGFKVVVGGPGDWQLASPATLDEIGIDFLVLGEAEIAGPKLFGAILAGRPPDDRLVKDRPPAAQEIPPVLFKCATALGSDVPFFLRGGTAWAEGRGERLTFFPAARKKWMLLIYPKVHVSTAKAYRLLDQNRPDGVRINSFTLVVAQHFPAVKKAILWLERAGLQHVDMSGSGSTVYGYIPSLARGKQILRKIDPNIGKAFLVQT